MLVCSFYGRVFYFLHHRIMFRMSIIVFFLWRFVTSISAITSVPRSFWTHDLGICCQLPPTRYHCVTEDNSRPRDLLPVASNTLPLCHGRQLMTSGFAASCLQHVTTVSRKTTGINCYLYIHILICSKKFNFWTSLCVI